MTGPIGHSFCTGREGPNIAFMPFIQVPDVDSDNTHFINSAHIVRTTVWKKGERAYVHLSDGASIEVDPKVAEALNEQLHQEKLWPRS
jgi:hypothetical protein